MVFPARQMIFDIIGDLLADRGQRTEFGFDERIIGLRDKFPAPGRLLVQIAEPIMDAEHGTFELGMVTIHGAAFTRTADVA
jgi:hypothetical protein